MKTIGRIPSAVACFVVFSTTAAMAATDREAALRNGAKELTSEEIAAQLVGQTVTFQSGDKKFLVYYGPDNTVSGTLVDGKWSDTGIYGVTMADRICLSWDGSDKGRLRCMTVLKDGDRLKKYHADGSFFGDILAKETGKVF